LGAFFVPFGQTSRIVKRDADGNINCTNVTACKNCINCTNCTACNNCCNCTNMTACINCSNCINQTGQTNLHCGSIRKRSPAGVGHVPYQVSLQRSPVGGDKIRVHFCDGVIIDPNWILTSAHCFDDDNSLNFIIHYGIISNDKIGMIATPGRLIVHPNYRQFIAYMPNDDIALIRTNASLKMSNGGLAYPVQVATSDITQGSITVSGWLGVIIAAPSSQDESIRRFCKIQVPIVKSQTSYPKFLLSEMFCQVDKSPNSSRPGFSVGPVVQNETLVGLVCGGKECGRPGRLGLYTNVSKYASWIDEQIALME